MYLPLWLGLFLPDPSALASHTTLLVARKDLNLLCLVRLALSKFAPPGCIDRART